MRETAPMDGYRPATYGDAFADVYDDWYADLHDPEAVADLLTASDPAGRILELGVGTGRLAWPLAARGRNGVRHRCVRRDAEPARRSRTLRRGGSSSVRGRHGAASLRSRRLHDGVRRVQHLVQLGGCRAEQARCSRTPSRGCLAPGGGWWSKPSSPAPTTSRCKDVAVRDITMDRSSSRRRDSTTSARRSPGNTSRSASRAFDFGPGSSTICTRTRSTSWRSAVGPAPRTTLRRLAR